MTQLSEVSVRVGKAGLTDSVIALIRTQLKKKKIIKIKFLSSAITGNKKALATQLENRVPCHVVHKVGFVVIVERVSISNHFNNRNKVTFSKVFAIRK